MPPLPKPVVARFIAPYQLIIYVVLYNFNPVPTIIVIEVFVYKQNRKVLSSVVYLICDYLTRFSLIVA